MPKKYSPNIKCIHNEQVNCNPNDKHCETCGWHPAVAKARLDRFCKEPHICVPKNEEE